MSSLSIMVLGVSHGAAEATPDVSANVDGDRFSLIRASFDEMILCLIGLVLCEFLRRFFGFARTIGGKAQKPVEKIDTRGAKAKKVQTQPAQVRTAEEPLQADDSVDQAIEAVVEAMEGRDSKVTSENIVVVLRECLRRRDAVTACKVEQFSRERGFPNTLEFYELLLKQYALSGEARAALLFDEMERDGFSASECFCIKLIANCVDSRFSAFAEHVHKYLRSCSMTTVNTYKVMLRVCGSCGFSGRVCDLCEEARADGLVPDAAMSTSLIKAAMQSGRMELLSQGLDCSISLLDRSTLDTSAHEMLLNAVLDACICIRDLTRLAAVVEKASTSGGRLSVSTYGMLIRSCGLLQRISHCRKLWIEMVETRGLCPNEVVLSCMLDALVRGDATGEAVELLHAWQSKIPPNVVIYSTLLKGYASMADAKGAMRIYREMQRAGVPMNVIAYTTLIDAQARAGDLAQAERLLKSMEEDGCAPCAITFSMLIKGHCRSGDLSKAMDVYRDMRSRGLPIDAGMFHTLLDVCIHQSCFDLADWLLNEMREQRVVPTSFTLSLVVKMWGKRRQLHEAFAAVRTMPREHGFHVDSQTGASLISACFFNGAYDRAMDALRMMKEWPHGKPDVSTYGNMIVNFVRRNARANLHQAVELAREACGLPNLQPAKGGFIRTDVIRRLYHVLRLRGLMEELGQPLERELRAASAACGAEDTARASACAHFLASFCYGPQGERPARR